MGLLVILDENRSHFVVDSDVWITVALSRHIWFFPVDFIDLAEDFRVRGCNFVCITKVVQERVAFPAESDLDVGTRASCSVEEYGGPDSKRVGRVFPNLGFVGEIMSSDGGPLEDLCDLRCCDVFRLSRGVAVDTDRLVVFFPQTFGAKKDASHRANGTHCNEPFVLSEAYFLSVCSVLLDDELSNGETDMLDVVRASEFEDALFHVEEDNCFPDEGHRDFGAVVVDGVFVDTRLGRLAVFGGAQPRVAAEDDPVDEDVVKRIGLSLRLETRMKAEEIGEHFVGDWVA